MTKKEVVDDCLHLDANRWMREGILQEGVRAAGSWRWTYRGGQSFLINYVVTALDPVQSSLAVAYSWVWTSTGQLESTSYQIRLATTQPHFGGLRWWFLCPLERNHRPCGRRVAKLYLPAAARYFGCRSCYNLTYRSSQQHDKRVDALRRNPEALAAMLQQPSGLSLGQLNLALKALG